ncbi:MAG: Tex family protein [Alcaligenaceae bacterium]|nr:Tex family protein [Alcaligenaceae bacterium]
MSHMIYQQLANELNCRLEQITATVELLDGGATVPFVARYRKEVTGGLDDTQLRLLSTRLQYLRELEDRKQTIIDSIGSQGKMTDELLQQIQQADTKQILEDLYLPYKPKRRTKGMIAIEAGLEPLANQLISEQNIVPLTIAQSYINPEKKIETAQQALDGARDLLAERFSEQATLIQNVRTYFEKNALIYSKRSNNEVNEAHKYQDWFDFNESIQTIPSHRVLALLRGREQGVLQLKIALHEDLETLNPHPCMEKIASTLQLPLNPAGEKNPHHQWLYDLIRWTWKVKFQTKLETEFINNLRERAETQAIEVFAQNLKDLLLSAPAGSKNVIGLDPGIRTGVKVAVIDHTGKVLDTTTVYPFEPRKDVSGTFNTLSHLIKKHQVNLIAIGNGTASRETEQLVRDLLKVEKIHDVQHIMVSESGASVYSASELAAKEFPDLDVSLRGAVSIARRLQDPLAELVKIDPKAIGVGQYQHDVNQRALANMLDHVVEDCVNAVGVDVNTASAALLSHVSGLNQTLANNIVTYRDEHGVFNNRKTLKKVPRFGEKTFEQSAGFLRIHGEEPLDCSAVHPEAYPVVQKMLKQLNTPIQALIGNTTLLNQLTLTQFTDERFGLPTIKDIVEELKKPGRDPRPEFKTATFMEGINDIKDLREGMILEGVVSNVANFGAFVDIGVHQDGLVHISALADRFVEDPRDIVRVGQTVKVKVIEVDVARKRIGLSMRTDDHVNSQSRKGERSSSEQRSQSRHNRGQRARQETTGNTAMAAAFAKLKGR